MNRSHLKLQKILVKLSMNYWLDGFKIYFELHFVKNNIFRFVAKMIKANGLDHWNYLDLNFLNFSAGTKSKRSMRRQEYDHNR